LPTYNLPFTTIPVSAKLTNTEQLVPGPRRFEIGGKQIEFDGAVVKDKGLVYIDDDVVTGQNDFLKLVIEAARANLDITPGELIKEIDLQHSGPGTRYVDHSVNDKESLDVAKEEIDGVEIGDGEMDPEEIDDDETGDWGETSDEEASDEEASDEEASDEEASDEETSDEESNDE
jgi:hypothetical protein